MFVDEASHRVGPTVTRIDVDHDET